MPKFGNKPENHVAVGMSFEAFSEFILMLSLIHIYIYYALGEGDGNLAVFDRVYYFKSAVTVFIEDEYDEFSMFCVYAEDGSLLNCLSLGESLTLDKSGMYTVCLLYTSRCV